MKLGSVTIKNFRSIGNTTIDLDNPVTALVGCNESGKSNILLAIKNFLNCESFDTGDLKQHSVEELSIEASFTYSDKEEKKLLTPILQKAPGNNLILRKSSSGYSVKSPVSVSKKNTLTTEEYTLLNDDQVKVVFNTLPRCFYLSVFRSVLRGKNIKISLDNLNEDEKIIVSQFLQIGESKTDNLINSDLNQMTIFLNKCSTKISQKLAESWKQGAIDVRIVSDQTKFCIHFLDNNNEKGVWTPPEDRSLGFQWFITFYSLLDSIKKENKNTVLLVDDAGSPFHAFAQQDLYEEFVTTSQKTKCIILYATHSPYMLNKRNKKEIYYIVKSTAKGTVANKYEDWRKIKSLPSPLKEIGISSPNDLLSDKTIVFEGRTDIFIYEKLSEIYPGNEIEGYHFESAGGWSEAIDFGGELRKITKDYFVLLDSDVEEAIVKATESEIRFDSIGNLIKSTSRKIETSEDLLPISTLISVFNEHGRKFFGENWTEISGRYWRIKEKGIIKHIKQHFELGNDNWTKFMESEKLSIIKKCLGHLSADQFSIALAGECKNYFSNLKKAVVS